MVDFRNYCPPKWFTSISYGKTAMKRGVINSPAAGFFIWMDGRTPKAPILPISKGCNAVEHESRW